MKSLVINIDSRCNAECQHCCFACSPDSKERISSEEIDCILDVVKLRNDIKQVSITGGEPMLRYQDVLKIIEVSSKYGKDVTLITNGFWAIDDIKTMQVLNCLIEAGLDALTVSYDCFHNDYVPVERVRCLFRNLKKYDISTAINMVVTRNTDYSRAILELQDAIFGVPITIVPASRIGRAREIPETSLYFMNFKNLNLKCPAKTWEFVIHHNGLVYPCCSPAVFETSLVVGDIRKESIDDIDNSLFTNILLFILKREGLGWFIDKIGLDLKLDEYVSVCEICKDIFSMPQNIELVYPEALKYYEDLRKEI